MTDSAKNIPLQTFHQQNGARLSISVAEHARTIYQQYREHRVVRQKAGRDVSHMGEFFLGGGQAVTFLDRL